MSSKKETFTKEDLNKFILGIIPLSYIENKEYKKLVKKFNNTKIENIYSFLEKNNLFSNDFWDFYDNLSLIKIKLSNCLKKYNDLYDDFNFFITNFKKEYENKINKYKKSLEKDKKRKEKELNNQRMYDISTGIFSVNEAESRRIFFDISWNDYSNKTILLGKELIFLIDSFYSYLYIKTEQVLYFYWTLFNFKKEDEKLYLGKKFQYFIENCIFNLNINIINLQNFEEINKIWIYFKHQDKKDKENYDFIYKKEEIEKNINFVQNIYSSLKNIKKIEKLANKIIELHNQYEEITNPLGLTGFEND